MSWGQVGIWPSVSHLPCEGEKSKRLCLRAANLSEAYLPRGSGSKGSLAGAKFGRKGLASHGVSCIGACSLEACGNWVPKSQEPVEARGMSDRVHTFHI